MNNKKQQLEPEELEQLVERMASIIITADEKAKSESRIKHMKQEDELLKARRDSEYAYSDKWVGSRQGWYFGTGEFGIGYYKDPVVTMYVSEDIKRKVFTLPPVDKRLKTEEPDEDEEEEEEAKE